MAANNSDCASIDGIVAALYATISGTITQTRDWKRFANLFWPQARLFHTARGNGGTFLLSPMSVTEYIEAAGSYFKTTGFFEKEIARQTDVMYPLAHALSTYETRHDETDPQPFARGLNSIQLFWDGRRWWITGIMWAEESDAQKIPEKCLPA